MSNLNKDPWENPLHERFITKSIYSDVDFPHYSDLNNFVKEQSTNKKITILDFGAGSSPYKKYFPNADYRRADITGASNLNYHISSDSIISEKDNTFDLIISTQVAEHVLNPITYFAETHRLLRPTGKFLITTHGVWEEHGSPFDYQRWTASGLHRDLEKCGFKNIRIFKITCGFRSTLLFFTRSLFSTCPPQGLVSKLIFKTFRFVYSKVFPYIYLLSDYWWPNDKIIEVNDDQKNPIWYIVIAAIAEK
jgi:SAM-dependent methyltransferase